MPLDISKLQPGDCLLYSPKGFFGMLIFLKTWHNVAHCECYLGNGKSVASRDGQGVNIYPLRNTELIYVLRPKQNFNINKALAWFCKEARGQKYDWLGLLRFTWRSDYIKGNTNNRQFCSEFLTRFYRNGDLPIFNKEDADAVAPYEFTLSEYLEDVSQSCGI